MPNLLWISDYPMSGSSFGVVTYELVKRLSNWKIYVASLGYEGVPISPLPGVDLVPLKDLNQLQYYITKLTPEITVVFHSYPLMEQLKTLPLSAGKRVLYVPIEGEDPSKVFTSLCTMYDKVLVPSKWSQTILKKEGIDSAVVPHGVDSSFFVPPASRTWKEFRFGYLGMNDVRKQIPRIMEAYAKLNQGMLVLAAKRDGAYSLDSLAKSYGISPIFIEKKFLGLPMTKENIRDFYHSLNVYVNVATEGFGLPSLESSACGVPQIALDHGASREVLGLGALYVRVQDYLETNIGKIGLADRDDLYKKMRFLIEVPQAREKIGRYALTEAKKWSWERASEILEEELTR